MDDIKYSVIIGEEVGTKIKAYLIAPKYTSIHVGDLVVAKGMQFRVLYVDGYCSEDGIEMTILRVALGKPYHITMVIKEEPIKWGDADDVDG